MVFITATSTNVFTAGLFGAKVDLIRRNSKNIFKKGAKGMNYEVKRMAYPTLQSA